MLSRSARRSYCRIIIALSLREVTQQHHDDNCRIFYAGGRLRSEGRKPGRSVVIALCLATAVSSRSEALDIYLAGGTSRAPGSTRFDHAKLDSIMQNTIRSCKARSDRAKHDSIAQNTIRSCKTRFDRAKHDSIAQNTIRSCKTRLSRGRGWRPITRNASGRATPARPPGRSRGRRRAASCTLTLLGIIILERGRLLSLYSNAHLGVLEVGAEQLHRLEQRQRVGAQAGATGRTPTLRGDEGSALSPGKA